MLVVPLAAANDSRVLLTVNTALQSFTTAGGTQNVTGLALTLAANSRYVIGVSIPITAVGGIGPNLTLGFTGPASPTLVSLKRHQMNGQATDQTSVITSFTTFAQTGAVVNTQHEIFGEIVTSVGNGGTLQLTAAGGGTTGTVTFGEGTNMYAIRTS